MSPLLSSALLSILRWLLTIAATWFVHKGIWDDASAAEYVSAAALGLLTLGWSIWTRRHQLIKTVTALALPKGSTMQDVHDSMQLGRTADPNTPHDQAPVITQGYIP